MSSFEAKDFDCYSFTLSLHPNGTEVVHTTKQIAAKKPLGHINMPTPNHFRQFPRQKYYFVLETAQFSSEDDPYSGAKHLRNDVFLDIGSGGLYHYNNILGGQKDVKSTDPVPDPRAGNAIIPLMFIHTEDSMSSEGHGSYRSVPGTMNPIQIPNMFGQTTHFRFIKTKSTVSHNLKEVLGADEVAKFDYTTDEIKFNHPVLMSFQIYVEKGGDEFN